MNKKIWLIVLLSILAISIVGMMTLLILKVPITFNNKKQVILYRQFRVDEISKLDIDGVSSDVMIVSHDADHFEVEVYGNEKDNVQAYVDDYTLKLSQDGNALCFGFCFGEKKIIVKVPKEASIEANVSTASGDIDIRPYMNYMKVATASGDVDIHEAGDVDILTVSGDVNLKKTDKAVVETTSGDVEINEVSSVLQIKSVSGEVEVYQANLILDSNIHTTSGDVFVKLKNNVYVDTKTTSGDVYVESNDRYAKTMLKISTTSGDIKVNN